MTFLEYAMLLLGAMGIFCLVFAVMGLIADTIEHYFGRSHGPQD